MATPKSKPRTKLSRERVLTAAIDLADHGGIESLTMRKLAAALGVEAMSLYNHVANKGDLVDAIVDRVISEIELPSGETWDVAIRTCAISAHDALLRHPWACSLVISPTSTSPVPPPQRLAYMEWLLGRLRGGGFSAELTYHAYHALDSHILGFTLWELGHSSAARDLAAGHPFADVVATLLAKLRADHPYLAEHGEQHLAGFGDTGPHAFEFGLDLILDGLRRLQAAS